MADRCEVRLGIINRDLDVFRRQTVLKNGIQWTEGVPLSQDVKVSQSETKP
jgi:hypothetical protein